MFQQFDGKVVLIIGRKGSRVVSILDRPNSGKELP